MGILRQGVPYAAPANYESPTAQSMRLYVESKANAQQRKEQIEQTFKETLWQEWKDSLSLEELMTFYVEEESVGSLPDKIKTTLRHKNALKHAQEYFDITLWPIKRKEILNAPASTSESSLMVMNNLDN
jgi:hypothetical protein